MPCHWSCHFVHRVDWSGINAGLFQGLGIAKVVNRGSVDGDIKQANFSAVVPRPVISARMRHGHRSPGSGRRSKRRFQTSWCREM